MEKEGSDETLFRKLLNVSDRIFLENYSDSRVFFHLVVGHVPLGDLELIVDADAQSPTRTKNLDQHIIKLNEKISQVLSFLLIHEILPHRAPINYEEGFRNEKENFDKILSVVKRDSKFLEIYKKYVEQLKNNYLFVDIFLNAEASSLKTAWKKVKGRYRLK